MTGVVMAMQEEAPMPAVIVAIKETTQDIASSDLAQASEQGPPEESPEPVRSSRKRRRI